MEPSAGPSGYDEIVRKLEKKYEVMGQDLSSYLDGLLYSDYLTYWDYIHVDTLLSLQNPKTSFPDEKVFIVYHQITELYFNLVIHELEQISGTPAPERDFFLARIRRIINYFRNLVDSFTIMSEGLDKDQFLRFRMALLPASGFQSAQYRTIEIMSTDLVNLIPELERADLDPSNIDQHLEKLYWRKGATELASGVKTLTLRQFESRYMKEFRDKGMTFAGRNLNRIFLGKFSDDAEACELLREFDLLANVHWPLAHLRSAGRYLRKDPEDIRATGGTNWQKYLPPRFQRIIFFPTLWTEQERSSWGKREDS